MATHYVRNFNFKESLSDAQVVEEIKFLLDQAVPVMLKVNGIRGVNLYSGAGGLRADLTVTIDMDDAGAYERLISDPGVSKIIGRIYGAWDMKTARQSFRREITPQLVAALSS